MKIKTIGIIKGLFIFSLLLQLSNIQNNQIYASESEITELNMNIEFEGVGEISELEYGTLSSLSSNNRELVQKGTNGTASWQLFSDGELIIGTGELDTIFYYNLSDFNEKVREIKFTEPVSVDSEIEGSLFSELRNLETISNEYGI